MKKLILCFQSLQKFVHFWWYAPLLAAISAIDHYIIFVPVLGMLVSSILLVPKRWLSLALWGGIGSWLGVWSVGWLSHALGISFLQSYFPEVMSSAVWSWAENFFKDHGVWVVLISGISPIAQQPAVMVASVAGTSMFEIGFVSYLGIQTKYLIVAYLASHAPQLLTRFRSVRDEIQELNVKTPKSPDSP